MKTICIIVFQLSVEIFAARLHTLRTRWCVENNAVFVFYSRPLLDSSWLRFSMVRKRGMLSPAGTYIRRWRL